jgi:hypothetical protein
MERYLFCVVPAGLIVTGVCMVIWPGAVAAQSRDRDDPSPVSAHQVWAWLWWRAAPTGSTPSWRACRGLSSTGSEVTRRANAVNTAYRTAKESRARLERAGWSVTVTPEPARGWRVQGTGRHRASRYWLARPVAGGPYS